MTASIDQLSDCGSRVLGLLLFADRAAEAQDQAPPRTTHPSTTSAKLSFSYNRLCCWHRYRRNLLWFSRDLALSY